MEGQEDYIGRILKELDISAVDRYTAAVFDGHLSFFEVLWALITSGKSGIDAGQLREWIWNLLFYELGAARPLFVKMLLFSAMFAIFNRFFIVKKGYVTEMSFLVVYGAMMIWLMSSFMMLKGVVAESVSAACSFFSVLAPAYCAVLVISGNAAGAGAFYELAFSLICVLEWLMKLVLLPGIHLSVLIGLIDRLFEEERFSRLCDLLVSGIRLALKLTLSAVLALTTVRSMLAAGQDGVAQNMALKSLSALPGVGNGFRFAEEVVFSCGILVKNCVGIAGLLILLLICFVPILKVFVFAVMYRVLAAVLQPFSDRRIVSGVLKVAGGCELYLKVLVYTMLLFMIELALLTFTTT